jgi:hypothetical protein
MRRPYMEDREYTPYQKGVIRRYYQNIDTIKLARLEELLPEIYLAGDGPKAGRLWSKAVTLLRQLGCPGLRVDYIEKSHDLEDLSEVLKEMR